MRSPGRPARRSDVKSIMTYEIIVQLKKEVLDPEGRAIQETLGRLGFRALKAVSVARRYTIEIDESAASDAAAGSGGSMADQLAETIAREYLANPVSETFQIKRL